MSASIARLVLAVVAISAGLLVSTSAGAQPAAAPSADTVRLTEWNVPWEKTTPRDPSVDATGRVWFVGQAGNYVARLDPKSGVFTRIGIDFGTHPQTGGSKSLAAPRGRRCPPTARLM